jgi:tRNA nucleotidyltransferase/poly(A) polymerase
MLNTALKIIKMIEDNGYQAYIVGGFPRDSYMKRESIDVDICTDATPRELKDIFKEANLPKEQYGGVTLYSNKYRFEITTFRRELKYENNRIPVKIEYIHDLRSDLLRRDFTINTLCMDSSGQTIDLLDGKKDIDRKIIKMVGDTDKKLKEDALRILRAVRFACVLNFEIDEFLKEKIKEYGYLLKNISYYRKKEELNKIFASNNAKVGCALLIELNLTEFLNIQSLKDIKLTSDLICIWAQLDVLDTYNFTTEESEQKLRIQQLLPYDVLDKYNLYYYGLYISSIVGDIKGIERKIITENYNNLSITAIKELQISATEICGILNTEPGSFIKLILVYLEKKVIYGTLNNNNQDLASYILKNYC